MDMQATQEPTTSSRPQYLFVLQTGLITTALALAGVYFLNKRTEDFNIMGWYADYVIPVGALIVGAVAGSGYGIASWISGVRISRWLLVSVLLFQAGAYVAAEYVDYRDQLKFLDEQGLVLKSTGKLPTFFEYYDYKARSFQWKPEHEGDKAGEPLGASGYVFVLLGAIGFIASGLIAPAVLLAVPYCQSCQRYMSSKTLSVLPASIPTRKIKKSDVAATDAYAKEQALRAGSCEQSLQKLRETAQAGDAAGFRQELSAAGGDERKANDKLPRRLHVTMVWCKSCETGHLQPIAVAGHGKQMKRSKLPTTPVAPDFVRAMLS